jgi:molybdopterin/thiamine biosynthesis adenylyltransferase/rhodanese-related sulfurtransferase
MVTTQLSTDLERYSCQIKLSEMGVQGQMKLANAAVLCVGAGGLAATALAYLAAAGIGKIGIVDGDVVSVNNLHRQVLFTPKMVGENKAVVLSEILQQQNSTLQCVVYPEFLTIANAQSMIEAYDIVLDCSDNFHTRYLVNDVCYLLSKPDVYAAVINFEGMITVFARGKSPCYRCLYPEPLAPHHVRTCAQDGVLGTVPGLFGLMQATEAIKIILNLEQVLYGNLVQFDLLNYTLKKRDLVQQDDCVLCAKHYSLASLPHYEEFASFTKMKSEQAAEIELIPEDLQANWAEYYCIDVREQIEYEQYNLNMPHFPLSVLEQNLPQITQLSKTTRIAVCCAHGVRSKIVANMLRQMGYINTYSLAGGLAAWQEKFK